MGQIVVGIGEYKISTDQNDSIKTFALGSCVAVVIYDKIRNIAGLMHVALPESQVDIEKAKKMPGHFADTGIPVFIEALKKHGVLKGNIWIKLIGGANVMDPNLIFDIGKRNALAIKKALWKNNLGPVAEDIGGDYSRTVAVEVRNGEITVSSGPTKWTI